MNIKILLGGCSSERDISILSGEAIYKAIKNKFNVELVFLNDDYTILSTLLNNDDIVINALHGGYGENGELQLYLDTLGVHYTGSNSSTCIKAMSKRQTKEIAIKASIPTARWNMVIDKKEDFIFPVVVKPDDQGSTVGLSIVNNNDELELAIKLASKYSNNIMVEQYISGKEITVGILDGKSLPIIEIIPNNNFYDYSAKYKKGESRYVCPSEIDKNLSVLIQEDAKKIYKELGCTKYARVDFRLDGEKHYLLEINTHPGMTDTSLFPMAAKENGISFEELIIRIIKK